MKVLIINTGGTLGMVGNPLRPALSAEELLSDIKIPPDIEVTLKDFKLRQDSTNVMHKDRVQMGQCVQEEYENFDAFVFLHGTDSLSETAAFFSMMFKLSLQKPLFVIGAQMTKEESGTDVPMQIANTLRVAAAFVRHSVVGVFNVCLSDVLHGARVRKRRDSDFLAFYTPGIQPVAQAWPKILIQATTRRKDGVLEIQGLRMDTQFEQHVATIVVSADSPPYILTDMVAGGRIRGVILECKGSGGIPDRSWELQEGSLSWIDAIRIATESGVHVGIISPFEDGRVELERYELGLKAKEAGAISLGSLTPAMGDVKFRQAIAMHPNDRDKIQKYVLTNILGELLPGFVDTD